MPGTGMGPGVPGAAHLEWQQPGVRLCHSNSELDLASKEGKGAKCGSSSRFGLDTSFFARDKVWAGLEGGAPFSCVTLWGQERLCKGHLRTDLYLEASCWGQARWGCAGVQLWAMSLCRLLEQTGDPQAGSWMS